MCVRGVLYNAKLSPSRIKPASGTTDSGQSRRLRHWTQGATPLDKAGVCRRRLCLESGVCDKAGVCMDIVFVQVGEGNKIDIVYRNQCKPI